MLQHLFRNEFDQIVFKSRRAGVPTSNGQFVYNRIVIALNTGIFHWDTSVSNKKFRFNCNSFFIF